MLACKILRLLTLSSLVGALLFAPLTYCPAQQSTADDLEAMLEKELQESDVATEQLTSKYPKFQEVTNAFLQGNFEEAEALLKEAKTLHPELPPAGVLIGSLYARANSAMAARTSYEKAVRDEPDDPEPYVVFGENAVRQRRFTDAALLFGKAMEVCNAYDANPVRKKNLSSRAYSGAALVAQARERWSDAERLLKETINLKGEDIQLAQRLGQVLFKRAQSADPASKKAGEQSAYREFKRAHNLDPKKVARPEINMARMYQAEGFSKIAEKLVKLARERDKDGLGTQLAAAQWAIDTGNGELLAECADAAIRIDATSLQSLVLDGFHKRLKEDFSSAEKSFRAAHDTAPANAAVLNQLAITLSENPDERKKKQALEFAQMSARMHQDLKRPVAREAAVTLGWVLYRQGRNLDAARSIQSALNAGRIGPEASFMAAKIAHDRGSDDAAYRLLKQALEGNSRLFPNRKEAEELLNKLAADR